jgi:sulfur-carrier protein
MVQVKVLYFASFQEAAGTASETLTVENSLLSLFEQLKTRYGFKFQSSQIRVALNGQFVSWDAEINDGAEIAFIPPVSGG